MHILKHCNFNQTINKKQYLTIYRQIVTFDRLTTLLEYDYKLLYYSLPWE